MKSHYDFSKGKQGAVAATTNKTRITIHIDSDILEAFRTQAEQQGKGYQTIINETLKNAIQQTSAPITLENLRQVIREELHAA
ncbi:MAG: BrnA antitoxin family protein [Sulfuriferula sp.]